MRDALIKQLTTMALQDQRIHVILPDIGVFAFKQRVDATLPFGY